MTNNLINGSDWIWYRPHRHVFTRMPVTDTQPVSRVFPLSFELHFQFLIHSIRLIHENSFTFIPPISYNKWNQIQLQIKLNRAMGGRSEEQYHWTMDFSSHFGSMNVCSPKNRLNRANGLKKKERRKIIPKCSLESDLQWWFPHDVLDDGDHDQLLLSITTTTTTVDGLKVQWHCWWLGQNNEQRDICPKTRFWLCGAFKVCYVWIQFFSWLVTLINALSELSFVVVAVFVLVNDLEPTPI